MKGRIGRRAWRIAHRVKTCLLEKTMGGTEVSEMSLNSPCAMPFALCGFVKKEETV
jgi:hypothetical protein